jgi:hypothetical protein
MSVRRSLLGDLRLQGRWKVEMSSPVCVSSSVADMCLSLIVADPPVV